MKTRNGFVSNSSSSSFLLDKHKMTEEQINAVKDHLTYAADNFPGLFDCHPMDWWSVYIQGHIIELSTPMDNFDMRQFLEMIGAEEAIIEK